MRTDMGTNTKKASVCRPWQKYFPPGAMDSPVPKCTIYANLRKRSEIKSDATALHYYGSNISYAQLMARIDRCADAFWGMGVRPGEIVSFVSVAIPETVYAMYALNRLGAVTNFIDPRTAADGIKRIVQEVDSKILVVLDVAWPKVKTILTQLPVERVIVQSANRSLPAPARLARGLSDKTGRGIPYGPRIIRWSALLRYGKGASCPEAAYTEDSVASITHTGGTTGFPKGVMITNDGMNAVAVSFEKAGLDCQPGQTFLNIIPIFSSYGVVCGVHMALMLGLKVVLIPKFTPAMLGKLVKKHKPEHMIGVPSFYEALMESEEMEGFDLSFVSMYGSGGDTMNEGLEEKLNEFLAAHGGRYPFAQGYGMSEVSSAASFCFNHVYKKRSAGVPALLATVSVFKPGTTEELGLGEQGEICITGPTMMKGYYNNPEETDRVMIRHPDGRLWIHSGDIGYMDEDGFIFIIGRIKHMIVRFDGHKVFPVQIESVLAGHEKVALCAVIGVPDRGRGQGELPLAVVELHEADKAGADLAAIRRELLALSEQNLEERGRAADVVFIDKMPLTAMGKIDHIALTERYRDHMVSSLG